MNNRQRLILLLVATDHKLWSIYRLVKVFDRVDFPSRIMESIQPLIDAELLEVDTLLDNGTPSGLVATDKGREFVASDINIESVREYVGQFDEAWLVLSFLDARLSRRDSA